MSDTMVANMDEIRAQIKASFNRSKEFLYQDPLRCHLYGYSELEHNLKQLRKHIFLDSAESLLEKITRWKRNKSSSLSDYNSHRGKYIIDKMDNFLDKYDFNPVTPKVIRSQSATYPYRQNSDEDFDSDNYKSSDSVKNNTLIENELMNKDAGKSEHQEGHHSNNYKHSSPQNSYPSNRTETKSWSKSDVDLPIKVENVESNHKTTGHSDTLRSNIVVGHSKFYVPTFEEFKRIHKQNSLPPKPERLIGLKRDDSFSKEFDAAQELCQVDRYALKERIQCKCVMGVNSRNKLIKSSSLNSGMDDSDHHYWRNLQRTNSLDRLSFDSLSKWDQYGNLMTSLETHIKSENPTRPKIIHRCFLEGKVRKNPQKTVEKRNNIINIKHFQTNKSPDIEKTKTFDSFHLHSKWGDLSRGGSSDNLPHHFSEKSRMYAYQMDRTDSTKSLNSMDSASSPSRVKLGTLAHKYISKNDKHPKLQRSNSERIRRGGNEVEVENVLAFYKKMSDKIARLKEPFSYRTESKEQKTIPSLGSPVIKNKFSKSPLSLSHTNKIPNKKINYTYSDFVPFEKRVAVSPNETQNEQLFNDQTKLKSASLNENKVFKQRHLDHKSSYFSNKRTHNHHSEKLVPEKMPLPKIYLDKYHVNLDSVSTSGFIRDCKSVQDVSDVLEITSSSQVSRNKIRAKHVVQAEFTDKIESASSSGVSSVTSNDSKQFGSEDANQDLETGNLQVGLKDAVLSSEDNGVTMETIQIFQENFEVVICSDCDQNFERLQNEKIYHCRSCQKNRIERKKTILEILETERRYGRDLKIMKQEFYRPMKTANLLSLEQLEAVFGNLDDLITVNEKFVDKLMEALDLADKERDEDFCTVSIGKVFQEVTPMFLVFEEYCVKQASAAVLLSTLEKEKDILRLFLQVSQAENSALRRMNLSSFLIVPVQRITRYPLLLNRVYSATPYCHSDRVAIKEAVMKVESHLEHINMHTNGNGGSKLKRKISNAAKKNMQVEHIELRKIALDALGWQHSDTEQVLSGKLLYTQPTDHLWAKRGKVLKFCPVHALLLRTGKILEEKPPRDNQLMFRGITGIDDAALVLIKEKNGRLMPLREPFHLDKCVVAIDPDFDEVFEVQELSTKDVYLIKAEDFKNTQEWVKQLKLHAWDRGAWRKRRPALANIMMSNMAV